MATTVYFVRHGQTDSNANGIFMGWSDEDLNELGYAQARCLSSAMSNLPIYSIYTSPLKRSYTTATILAEPHNLNPLILQDLIEIRLGEWEGVNIDEVKQKWPELWKQYRCNPSNVTFPNGESYKQLLKRAVRAFHNAIEVNRDKHIVFVTHRAVIRVLIAYILGTSNDIHRKFDVDNSSMSVLEIDKRGSQLVKFNITTHLSRCPDQIWRRGNDGSHVFAQH